MERDPTLIHPPFYEVAGFGLGGLVTKFPAQDIKDQQSPDLRNIVFDGGMVGTRPGTTLKLAAPAGETGIPSQLMKAKDSRGTDYLIAVWGTNFYLFDSAVPQWIKLNGSYSPAKSGLFFGNDNWNQGTGNDSFYFCNGVDSMMKWNQALSTIKTALTAVATSLVLNDSSGFPSSGTLIMMDNTGTPFTVAYSANDGVSTLTITATGKAVNAGNSVTTVIQQMSGMKIGKIVKALAPSSGFRLFVANNVGNESSIYFSKSTNQEDFGTTTDQTTGGVQIITDGDGGILDLVDLGTAALIVKKNAFSQFYFTINATLNDIIGVVTPMVFSESMEPVGEHAAISVDNDYYYVTKNDGIYQLQPSYTGYITLTKNNPFSDDILTLFKDPNLTFVNSRTEYFTRVMYFLASTINGVNNLIFVYDFVHKAWSIWDNLNAVDVKEIDGILYFLCKDDGSLYYLDATSSQDQRSGQNVGFQSHIYSKRFDFKRPSNPKQQSLAMIQGVITPNTKLYVDVLYNEGGSLGKTTYVIDGEGTYVSQVPVYGLGRASLGQNPLGGFQLGTIGFFRVYLDLMYRLGAHVIQFDFYTENAGDNWGVANISMNSVVVEKSPPELNLSVV